MIDRATWSQFSYWFGTEIWLIYCSSANHCFTIVYCFIPCLTRRKWGLWKYWSLQSIQFYLYAKRVLATFFPFYNFSFRAVKISGGRTRWRYLEGKTAKHRQQLRQYQCLISGCDARQCGCQLEELRFTHKSNLCPYCLSRFQAC